jgi:YVTN family beta-propeller protein
MPWFIRRGGLCLLFCLGANQPLLADRYDDWVASGNLPAGQHGLAKDADGDGIPNLLEFAYGSNPLTNSIEDQPSFHLNPGGVTGRFTYHRSKTAAGLTIEVVQSQDLTNWSVLNSSPGNIQVTDFGAYEELRHTVPLTQQQSFYRLRVSLATGIVPDQTYPSTLENHQIGPTLGAAHHNQPHIINGYLVLAGNAVHEFWDITDPFNPIQVGLAQSPYRFGEAESHTVSFARYSNGHTYMATVSGFGIDLWDVSDVRDPILLNAMVLEGINYGDFTEAVWGVCWQGKYIFVGGTSTGIHVVDAGDPSNPVLITRVPTTSLGGVSAGPVFAIGNLLVAATPKNSAGLATLNIGDPANPLLQAFVKPAGSSYIGWFYETYAFLQSPLRIYDVTSDPANIQLVKSMSTASSEYLNFGDDILYLGLLRPNPGALKYDISNPLSPVLLGKVEGRTNLLGNDDQFTVPIGNLLVLSDDQAEFGSIIAVSSAARDTKPPRVAHVNPVDGATNQPLTSRIGLSFSDQIDFRSVNPNTILIRPVGGQPLAGNWSLMHTIVNFWPDQPLQSNTLYEILLPAGGVTDLVGNPVTQPFRSVFSTGASANNFHPAILTMPAVLVGQVAIIQATGLGAGVQYKWQFGDGSETAFSASVSTAHTYNAAGRYPVVLTVTDGQQTASASAIQVVHRPLTPNSPTRSSTIVLDEIRGRAWVANPDSATVSAITMSNFTKALEVPVGTKPTTLAQAPDGTIWVANQESSTLSVLNPTNGATLQTIPLRYGAAPYGIVFSPNGQSAFVSLQGTGQVLQFDPVTRTLTGTAALGPDTNHLVPELRGLAVSADSSRLFVTRFISPAERGEVFELDAGSLALVRTFPLANDPGPDTPDSGRGVPNYLSSIAISPDGLRAWLPSKKDNTSRGLNRDGLALTHENAVRTILSQIDLSTNSEALASRIDLNDRDMAFAAAFSPVGDLAFVATEGQNHVDVFNAYSGELIGSFASGLAPQGLALSSGGRLWVQHFMSRSARVFD